jgi:cell wall-associated NlpC family hydrolase
MIEVQAARQSVVAAARSWLGTPFHDCAAIKGVGVDCAHLIARAYEEAGIIDHVEIERYSPQWFLHHSEELFLGYIERAGAREIAEADANMGDVVMYKIARCYAHGGIIVEWPETIIHAHKPSRAVVTSGGMDGDLGGKSRRFFTLW